MKLKRALALNVQLNQQPVVLWPENYPAVIPKHCTIAIGWFPNLTRAYDNNGRCPRQKFVFGIFSVRFAGGPLASFFDPPAYSFWLTPGGRLDPLKFIICNSLYQTTQ